MTRIITFIIVGFYNSINLNKLELKIYLNLIVLNRLKHSVRALIILFIYLTLFITEKYFYELSAYFNIFIFIYTLISGSWFINSIFCIHVHILINGLLIEVGRWPSLISKGIIKLKI